MINRRMVILLSVMAVSFFSQMLSAAGVVDNTQIFQLLNQPDLQDRWRDANRGERNDIKVELVQILTQVAQRAQELHLAGIDPFAPNDQGETPLHVLVRTIPSDAHMEFDDLPNDKYMRHMGGAVQYLLTFEDQLYPFQQFPQRMRMADVRDNQGRLPIDVYLFQDSRMRYSLRSLINSSRYRNNPEAHRASWDIPDAQGNHFVHHLYAINAFDKKQLRTEFRGFFVLEGDAFHKAFDILSTNAAGQTIFHQLLLDPDIPVTRTTHLLDDSDALDFYFDKLLEKKTELNVDIAGAGGQTIFHQLLLDQAIPIDRVSVFFQSVLKRETELNIQLDEAELLQLFLGRQDLTLEDLHAREQHRRESVVRRLFFQLFDRTDVQALEEQIRTRLGQVGEPEDVSRFIRSLERRFLDGKPGFAPRGNQLVFNRLIDGELVYLLRHLNFDPRDTGQHDPSDFYLERRRGALQQLLGALHQLGIDPFAPDADGNTPLHVALQNLFYYGKRVDNDPVAVLLAVEAELYPERYEHGNEVGMPWVANNNGQLPFNVVWQRYQGETDLQRKRNLLKYITDTLAPFTRQDWNVGELLENVPPEELEEPGDGGQTTAVSGSIEGPSEPGGDSSATGRLTSPGQSTGEQTGAIGTGREKQDKDEKREFTKTEKLVIAAAGIGGLGLLIHAYRWWLKRRKEKALERKRKAREKAKLFNPSQKGPAAQAA